MFVIAWGQRFYGRTDYVPGVFHVATLFFHLMMVPLFPMNSCLIVAGDDGQELLSIPRQWRSILLTWVRAALLPAGLVSGMVLLVPPSPLGTQAKLILWGLFLAWIAALLLPQRFRPSHRRAYALADAGGVSDRVRAKLDAVYGAAAAN